MRGTNVNGFLVATGFQSRSRVSRKTFTYSYNRTGPGYNVFEAYRGNNFKNKLHRNDMLFLRRYGQFLEKFSDEVRFRKTEETPPGEGYMPIIYMTNVGIVWNFARNLLYKEMWLPPDGYIVPKKRKGRIEFFKPGTLVPLETTPFDQRAEVEKLYEELGLPQGEISGFTNRYVRDESKFGNQDLHVYRLCGTNWACDGPFSVFIGYPDRTKDRAARIQKIAKAE